MDFLGFLNSTEFIKFLMLVCALDLFLGFLRACKEKSLNSSMGINGAIRKVGMMGSALFLKLMDLIINVNLIDLLPKEIVSILNLNQIGICEFFCIIFIICEFVSAIKNMTRINIPILKNLNKIFDWFLDNFTTETKIKKECK